MQVNLCPLFTLDPTNIFVNTTLIANLSFPYLMFIHDEKTYGQLLNMTTNTLNQITTQKYGAQTQRFIILSERIDLSPLYYYQYK